MDVSRVTYGASLSVTTTLPQLRRHAREGVRERTYASEHACLQMASPHHVRACAHDRNLILCTPQDLGSLVAQRTAHPHRLHSRASASDKRPSMFCFGQRQSLLHVWHLPAQSLRTHAREQARMHAHACMHKQTHVNAQRHSKTQTSTTRARRTRTAG
jgi:hypothetical protein